MDLIERILNGDLRAAGRLITMVENATPEAVAALKELYPHTGQAYVIGVTGPPGSGKSTLTDRITGELRQLGKTVGIIAVDPTSPLPVGRSWPTGFACSAIAWTRVYLSAAWRHAAIWAACRVRQTM
jgi:putative protein kinase ArgK-like GTPase of G3E family